ncbi:MAG: hypothetical protein ACJ701_05380 [Nitrososphaera sp.]
MSRSILFLIALLVGAIFSGAITTFASMAYAQEGEMVKTTDKGTLAIGLSPAWSDAGQATFTVRFLNPGTDTMHQHQDYDFKIIKDGQQVFSAAQQTGQAILHNVEGTLTIPYTFRESGNYTIQVYLAGTGIPAIPTDEEATFPITVVLESDAGVVASNVTNATAGIIIKSNGTTTTRNMTSVIEELKSQDVAFANFDLIMEEQCLNHSGNGTMSQYQCAQTILNAQERWCGLEAYHKEKCDYINGLAAVFSIENEVFGK